MFPTCNQNSLSFHDHTSSYTWQYLVANPGCHDRCCVAGLGGKQEINNADQQLQERKKRVKLQMHWDLVTLYYIGRKKDISKAGITLCDSVGVTTWNTPFIFAVLKMYYTRTHIYPGSIASTNIHLHFLTPFAYRNIHTKLWRVSLKELARLIHLTNS